MIKKSIIEPEVLLKYFQGETNEEENSNLLKWIYHSKTNEKFFFELKYLWESSKLSGFPIEKKKQEVWEKFVNKINASKELTDSKRIKRFQSVIRTACKVAAIFILAFCLSWFLLNRKGRPADNALTYYEFKTPKGAKSEINLPDGSKIWLNSKSLVRFPSNFKGNNRKIYLEGEAYFDIKKNEKEPLVISTSDINIKVMGTAFNVKSYPGEGTIETTLERGIILLEKKSSNRDGKNSIITLKPHQRVTFIKKDGKILLDGIKPPVTIDSTTKNTVREEKVIVNDQVETEKYTAWKDGKLIFDNETFENLAVKLERWYDIKIHIQDERLKKIRFTGTFEHETIEQGLAIMKLTTPIIYSMNKNNIYIKMKSN